MYEVIISTTAKKDIKTLPRQVQKEFAKHLDILALKPDAGERLKGILRDYWKYAFSIRSTSYRIVYQVSKKKTIVLVVMVGSRENFYDRLKKRL